MPQAEAFYQTLVQTGEINKDRLKALIDKGGVSKKQSKRVGEILYKLAYTFLRKAEKGELEQYTK
jgi:endonuclease III